jgi:hypothetical protein
MPVRGDICSTRNGARIEQTARYCRATRLDADLAVSQVLRGVCKSKIRSHRLTSLIMQHHKREPIIVSINLGGVSSE